MPRGVDRGDAREAEVPLEVRVDERRDERARGAVDVHRHVEPRAGLQVVERVADLLHGLVRAVVGRADDRDHADRVLVAARHGLLGREVEPVALHRHEAHLDVPVAGELLPADLDVDAHDEVRRVRRLALGAPPLLPAPLQREPAEHRRLARARRRAPGGVLRRRCVPQVPEDVDAAGLERRGLRVLVLVDHVLVEALGHQALGLRLHPRGHEGRQVEARVAVERELVVDDLVGDVRRPRPCGQLGPWDLALQLEDPRDRRVGAGGRGWLRRGHVMSLPVVDIATLGAGTARLIVPTG